MYAMRRVGLMVIALAIVAVLPASAGGSQEDDGKIQLTYWHAAPFPPLAPTTEAMVEDFMAQNPDIEVQVEGFSFGEYFQKIDTATAAGTGPDVFWVDSTAMRRYVYYDSIVPLTQFVGDDYLDDWLPIPREDATFRGDLWAVPMHQSTEQLVYNKAILEEVGIEPPLSYDEAWTLEEFRSALEAVVQRSDDGTTQVWGYTTLYPPGTYSVQPWIEAMGGSFMNGDWTEYEGYINSPATVAGLEWWASLHTDGLAPVDRIPDAFQTGKVAFLQANPFALNDIRDRYPDLEIGVTPLPGQRDAAGNMRFAVISGSYHIGIHSQSEHPEAAWKLIEFITNYDGHKRWIEETGYAPARQSVYDDLDEWHQHPKSVFMNGLVDHAVHRHSNEAWVVFNQEFTDAIRNSMIGADVQSELDAVAENAAEELARY